jgi:hypothetical protein
MIVRTKEMPNATERHRMIILLANTPNLARLLPSCPREEFVVLFICNSFYPIFFTDAILGV